MKYLFLFSFILVSNTVFSEELIIEYKCPERIETSQKIVQPVSGWQDSALSSQYSDSKDDENYSHNYLSNVAFSDGPPEDRVFLIPDNEHELSNKNLTARWDFINSEIIWVSCEYKQTTVYLSQKLPPGLKSCFARRESEKGVSIQSVWCEKIDQTLIMMEN